MNVATKQGNQVKKLFNDYLAKGRILVRYALDTSHRIEMFRIDIFDIEKRIVGVEEVAGLIHLHYHGLITDSGISRHNFVCRTHGPTERGSTTVFEMFDLIVADWKTLGDPVVVDDKCLWLEPDAFVGCVRPRGDMKGLPRIFPASHPTWVFPFMCLFAGQFRQLVYDKSMSADDRYRIPMLDNFMVRFDSFFVNQCWYKALGKPVA